MRSQPFVTVHNTSVFAILIGCLLTPLAATAQPTCRTGGEAIANAYVRANPIYAAFFGRLEDYVASNRSHFQAGGDAIRCAQALSRELMQGAIQNYNPNALQRQHEMNARLGGMGISPGPVQPTVFMQIQSMGQQSARLARVLSAAADDNFQPLYTPTNELEQMQMFAALMLPTLLQDPTVRAAIQQQEPLIKESANMEYQIVLSMTAELARR